MFSNVVVKSVSSCGVYVLCALQFVTESQTARHAVHTSQPEILFATTPHII
jgi:hypothetical protein